MMYYLYSHLFKISYQIQLSSFFCLILSSILCNSVERTVLNWNKMITCNNSKTFNYSNKLTPLKLFCKLTCENNLLPSFSSQIFSKSDLVALNNECPFIPCNCSQTSSPKHFAFNHSCTSEGVLYWFMYDSGVLLIPIFFLLGFCKFNLLKSSSRILSLSLWVLVFSWCLGFGSSVILKHGGGGGGGMKQSSSTKVKQEEVDCYL